MSGRENISGVNRRFPGQTSYGCGEEFVVGGVSLV
jgi:hypothetical protein